MSDTTIERESGTNLVPYTEDVGVIYSGDTDELEGIDPFFRQVASQLQNWLNDQRSKPGPLERPDFENAKDVFSEMKVARRIASEDDTVSNFLEITEGTALQGVKWEHEDPITTDVFNQMAAKQDLDAFVRKMWRELDTCNQGVIALWWDSVDFKARGKTDKGNARKTTKTVWCPTQLSVLDNTRVLPVEIDAFGGERMAWRATPEEWELYQQFLKKQRPDPAMERFYAGPYTINPAEAKELADFNQNLILLDADLVKRHTGTKSDYERWAPVRLKSIFRLIDMKLQLMAADRVALVGAANYILLVKKGDKDMPARTEEIQNLKEGFRTLAKVPVIFSDHRLEIEIITPKTDYTLDSKKYTLLDSNIIMRLVNGVPNSSAAGAFKLEIGRSTQLTLQNRRHMLKRFIEREIARAVVEHPKNAGVFDSPPSLSYSPAQIQVGDVTALAQQIISLRTMNELSRESTLEWFGFDQGAEAMRRQLEEILYDDTFKTQVPFSAANGAPPAAQGQNGTQGGRPDGGGQPSQNPQDTNQNDKGNTSSGTRKKTTT